MGNPNIVNHVHVQSITKFTILGVRIEAVEARLADATQSNFTDRLSRNFCPPPF